MLLNKGGMTNDRPGDCAETNEIDVRSGPVGHRLRRTILFYKSYRTSRITQPIKTKTSIHLTSSRGCLDLRTKLSLEVGNRMKLYLSK